MSEGRLVTLALVLLTAACSTSSPGGSDGGACATPAPESCPADAPGYATTVAPLIKESCVACHQPGGPSAQYLETYEQVFALRSSVLVQVDACRMPPADYPALTATNRANLLGWLVCGAQDN